MLDRREFIAALAAALAGTYSSKGSAALLSQKGHLLLSLTADDEKSLFRFFDWDTGKHRDYPIPLQNPHSLSLDRKDPRVAYCFESWGSALRINLESGESVRVDHQGSDLMFSGHGVQSKSGEFLYCTEIDRKLGTVVSIRTAKDLKRVGIAPKECNLSHQIVHMPDSSLIACGNMGKDGAITFFDYEKGEVLRRVELGLPILHLAAISSTEAIGVSHLNDRKPRPPSQDPFSRTSLKTTSSFYQGVTFFPGPIVSAKTDGTTRKYFLESEPELFRFTFGVAPLPKPGMFLSSQQSAGQVLLWKEGQVVHRFAVEGPSHLLVSKNGKEFLVRSKESSLKVFSLETYSELAEIRDPAKMVLTVAAY